MKICLVGSGGGHLNQLLQLEFIYSKHDYYFVTYKTVLSESIAQTNKVYFINNITFGLLKKNIRYWEKLIINLFESFRILLKEKPDVVISTGAGVALWTCYFSKLLRKKFIYIETIAHIDTPSLFGRLVVLFADLIVVQWKLLLKYYRKAKYGGLIFDFSKLKTYKTKRNSNKILVTVGTHGSFDRLLEEINRLIETGRIKGKVFAQIDESNFSSDYMETFKNCSPDKMDEYLTKCGTVITHGGSSSIANSLSKGCTVIAVPRKKAFGEHYDNHQVEIIRAFEEMGLILGVYKMVNLGSILEKSKTFRPRKIIENSKIQSLIEDFIKV